MYYGIGIANWCTFMFIIRRGYVSVDAVFEAVV